MKGNGNLRIQRMLHGIYCWNVWYLGGCDGRRTPNSVHGNSHLVSTVSPHFQDVGFNIP